MQKWYRPLLPYQVWCGSWVMRRLRMKKCDAFIFSVFFTLWNDEVCDNGNAMKQCNFQNINDVIAYRKVWSCTPIYNNFCGPPEFSFRCKFIPKIINFGDFSACKPTS